jgi:glutathione S-transferase
MTDAAPFELYHNQMSTCSAKVRLVLAEKTAPWTSRLMDLRRGDNLRPEYLKLNPAGVVPTLITRGRALIESTVICEYLDDVVADNPLRPSDPWAAAQMRLWTKQLDEGVHFATGVVSFCIAFREQFLVKRPEEIEAFLAGLQSQERRDRLKVSLRDGMDASFFPPAVKRMTKLLDDMEAALQNSDWIAGSGYSLADTAMTPYVVRLVHLGFDFQIEKRPRIADWLARVGARASFDEAMARWYEPSYLELFDRVRPNARARLKSLIHRA